MPDRPASSGSQLANGSSVLLGLDADGNQAAGTNHVVIDHRYIATTQELRGRILL